MRALGTYTGAQRSLQGDLVISFAIEDESILEDLLKLEDKRLVIEATKYSEKRSLNANKYFWKLCDLIAEQLGSTKEEIYLLQLSRYGFWFDKDVHKEAVPQIKAMFRYVEEYDDTFEVYEDGKIAEMQTLRCYLGSSHYSKEEMARLIDGTVQDAHDLGISTWSQEEINSLVEQWSAR